MARSARLERATHCLEGSCSIHLSYERNSLCNLPDSRRAASFFAPSVRDEAHRIRSGYPDGQPLESGSAVLPSGARLVCNVERRALFANG
jgi:hypothetical protein